MRFREPRSYAEDDTGLLDFLRGLDNSDCAEVSEWEAQFLGSCLERISFSPKQREVIEKIQKKYLYRL